MTDGTGRSRGRTRLVAACVAAWALGGGLLVGQTWLWSRLQGIDKAWWECLVVTLPDLAIWAGLVPAIAWMARLVPPRLSDWSRTVGIHLPLAITVVLGATVGHGLIALGLGWMESAADLADLLSVRIPLHLPTGVALYGAVLLGAHAFREDGRDGNGQSPAPPAADGVAPAREPATATDRIALPADDGVRLIAVDEIAWLEADGNYVVLSTRGGRRRVRGPLAAMEERLPRQFLRIHRSRIVNLDRAVGVHRWRHGDFVVVLDDGQQLRMSRTYRDAVEERLGARL